MLTRRTPLKAKKGFTKKAERPTLQQMKSSGLVQKASSFTQKPRKALKPRSPKNKGGQVALFKRIWGSRPHKCEVCGVRIEEATASNFSHLLPKGTYPDFKLREDNIVIKCKECHDNWHLWGQAVLAHNPRWKKVVEKFRMLRAEAYAKEEARP